MSPTSYRLPVIASTELRINIWDETETFGSDPMISASDPSPKKAWPTKESKTS